MRRNIRTPDGRLCQVAGCDEPAYYDVEDRHGNYVTRTCREHWDTVREKGADGPHLKPPPTEIGLGE